MNTSEDINEIAAALAKAQGAILNPAKTSENPYFSSRYADLATGLNAIRSALSSNGLAVTQSTRINGELMILETQLTHSSGQWFQSEFLVCKALAPPQQVGSALSYARRYSLFALVGISGDDDDDGNIANSNGAHKGATINEAQVVDLRAEIEARGADEQKFLKYMKVGSLAALPATELLNAFAALAAKGKK